MTLSPMVRIGNFLFRRRNLVFALAYIALLAGLRPVPFGGSARADRWMDALGVFLLLLGQGLRVLVIGYAYIIRGGKKGEIYAEGLVTAGLFAHSRNPLYLGNLFVLLGLFVIHNNPWVYVLGVPLFLFSYSAIVAAEEAYLRRHYGPQYEDYCRRVPRWRFNLRGLRRSLRDLHFNGAHVVLMEYGSTYSWVVAVLLLLARQAVEEPPFPQRPVYLLLLAGIFAVTTPFWVWHERWKPSMKRRRRDIQSGFR